MFHFWFTLSALRVSVSSSLLCSGFHRPLGVIPPSSSVSPGHSRSPPSAYHLPHPQPRYHAHYPAPTHHLPGPAAYGSQFPSHFYPEKLYQYWHHYYPRIPGTPRSVTNCLRHICKIPGAYKRLDNEMLTTYYDRDRSKSKSPKPMFYKSPSPQRSHWGGYFWLLLRLVLFDANIYRIVIQIFDSSMNTVTALNPSELNASSERYRNGWLIVNLESLNLTPLW